MTIKSKTIAGFLISSSIIALLVAFELIAFLRIRDEIYALEFSDSVRSLALQIRRHEKNFFLDKRYDAEGGIITQRYAIKLEKLLEETNRRSENPLITRMLRLIKEYERSFETVSGLATDIHFRFNHEYSPDSNGVQSYAGLFETILMEHDEGAEAFLIKFTGIPPSEELLSKAQQFHQKTAELRSVGERMIALSDDLDQLSRTNVERSIELSRWSIVLFFVLFVLVGLGTLFSLTSNITRRINRLTELVRFTGETADPAHYETSYQIGGGKDEVDVLTRSFNDMQNQIKQREQKLAQKNEELLSHRKLAAIGTLAAGVAHEINNPLNNIYLSSQVLSKKADSAHLIELTELTGEIMGQALRMKGIVQDLLDFSRDKPVQSQKTELFALIKQAFKSAIGARPKENMQFEWQLIPDDETLIVEVDSEQIERCFINIFENAIAALNENGRIEVHIKVRDDMAIISVKDNGSGISSQDLERIFEPFYTKREGGTGLGLAMVFNTIQKHNGKIDVDSALGQGTTITISLPCMLGQRVL